jgi:transposase
MLESYLATNSYAEVKKILQHRFPQSTIPADSTIKRLVDRFRSTGSVFNTAYQRHPTVLTDEMVTVIQDEMMNNPRLSLRRLAQQVDVSYKTAYRAVREQLGLHPYRVTVTHQLLPADHQARVHFCEWLGNVLQNDVSFLDNCYFTDEAWFHLNGYVNSQNSRHWCDKNPYIIHEEPLHSSKIGVWAAMSAKRIFIVFFDSIITSAIYCGIVDKFVETFSEDDILHGWFQQDNAPAHTANATLRHLEIFFGDRVITRGLWPARSPDLSPPDFFLWGYLKGKVYENNPTTLAALRQNIETTVSSISANLLNAVMQSLAHRMTVCLLVNGGQFQHF